MDIKYNFKDDQFVSFDNGVIRGKGFVVGACDIGNAIVGITYMVELKECNAEIPNDKYPYRTIPVHEYHLSKEV